MSKWRCDHCTGGCTYGCRIEDSITERRYERQRRARSFTYDRRNSDGQRLYLCLALFDARDGTPLADIVQAAREGWERSHRDMDEDRAWDDFDRLIARYREASPLPLQGTEPA